MNVRRSGRTAALLKAALAMTQRGRRVNFVVWNRVMISVAYSMLKADYMRGLGYPEAICVMTYDEYRRKDKSNQFPVIFDHHVTEELAHQNGYGRRCDGIGVYLKLGDWYQWRVIKIDTYESGHFRLAMHEPLSYMCTGNRLEVDSMPAMKTVDFHRTSNTKDGLTVFEHRA